MYIYIYTHTYTYKYIYIYIYIYKYTCIDRSMGVLLEPGSPVTHNSTVGKVLD